MPYPLEPPILGCGSPPFVQLLAAAGRAMSKAAAAAAADGTSGGGRSSSSGSGRGRRIFLKPQRCALLNKYSGGGGREEAPRGQIVGRVEKERCVKGRRHQAMGGGGGGWC